MELEPIEQLHGLLRERVKVEEKIHSVRSALEYVKTSLSQALAQRYLDYGRTDVSAQENLMKEEQNYERLLQALHDMRAQIEERVRPVAEQVVQAEVGRLRVLADQHQNAIVDCKNQIDQNILSCREQIAVYRQKRADLAAVSERLASLGAESLPLPEEFSTERIKDIIQTRLEELRNEGKL